MSRRSDPPHPSPKLSHHPRLPSPSAPQSLHPSPSPTPPPSPSTRSLPSPTNHPRRHPTTSTFTMSRGPGWLVIRLQET